MCENVHSILAREVNFANKNDTGSAGSNRVDKDRYIYVVGFEEF
jgi:hypothetical protein